MEGHGRERGLGYGGVSGASGAMDVPMLDEGAVQRHLHRNSDHLIRSIMDGAERDKRLSAMSVESDALCASLGACSHPLRARNRRSELELFPGLALMDAFGSRPSSFVAPSNVPDVPAIPAHFAAGQQLPLSHALLQFQQQQQQQAVAGSTARQQQNQMDFQTAAALLVATLTPEQRLALAHAAISMPTSTAPTQPSPTPQFMFTQPSLKQNPFQQQQLLQEPPHQQEISIERSITANTKKMAVTPIATRDTMRESAEFLNALPSANSSNQSSSAGIDSLDSFSYMGSEDEEEYTSSSQYRRLSYAPQNPPLLPPDASIQAQQRLQNQMMEDAGLIDELYISTQQVAKAVSLKMGMENESVSSSVLAAATLLAGGQISHDFANQAPHHPPVIKRRPSFFASAGHGIANVLGTSSSSSTHLSGTSNGSIAQWFTPQTSQQQRQPPPTPQLQRKPSINNLTNEANDGGLVRKLSKKLSMVFIGAGGSNVTPTSTLTPAMSTDLTATTSSTLPDSPATTATPVYATPSGYMSAPGTPKPDPREPAGGARKTGGRRLSLTTSFGSGKSLMSRILPLTSRSAAATPQPRSATPSTTTDSTSASGGGGGGGGGGESLDFEGVKGEGAGMLMPFACEHCGRPFLRKHDLKRHIASTHGGDGFKCDVCGKAFTRQDALNRHVKGRCKGMR